jgi:spermidine synthase
VSERRASRPLYLGVFTTSMAVLTLEIALTRIFSVSLWYHLAFMVISTALLGFGASGTLLTLRRDLIEKNLERNLTVFAGLTAVAIVISFAIMTRLPLDPLAPLGQGLSPGEQTWQTGLLILLLLVDYVLVVVPFFFAGLTLGSAFSAFAKHISTLYFADLIGAGVGCLVVIGALWFLPGQGVVLFAAGLAALAAFFFSRLLADPATRSRSGVSQTAILTATGAIFLFALAPFAERFLPLYIPPSKPLSQASSDPTIDLVYTGFTPFARVDVMYREGASLGTWGLSPRCTAPPSPEQLFITIDAAAITTITTFDGNLETISFVNCAPSSLAYQVRGEALESALVIGPGGGIDVLTAFYNGVERIVGAEINPLIINLVAEDDLYRDYAGGLYTDYSQIDIELAEGRNFVARSKEKYDLIQFSQVDTWAAAASGAYSLSENFLYTTEAFLDYYDHLTDDGMLTVGRWYFEPPQQAFRLVTIGATALEERGVADPAQHFIVVRAGDTSTFIMKKTPFTADEITRLRDAADKLGFAILYAPDETDPDNWFVRFFTAPDRAQFYRDYPLDVTPTTDDRPFFFEYYGWSNFGDFRSGKVTLVILLIQALLLAAGLILWPLWRFRRQGLATRGARRFMIYFAALGMGFIFIEIGLMQRFILFLGHPVYSTSVVLFSVLTFSGIGSFLSGRLLARSPNGPRQGESGERDPRWLQRRVIPLLGLVTLVYVFALPPLFQMLLGLELTFRVAVSILLLAPLGLLMGMPFPLGIRLVDQVNTGLVPWAWGVNGFSSVVGSILAVMIAQSYGFALVIGFGVVIYLVGLAAVLSLRRVTESAPQPGYLGSEI